MPDRSLRPHRRIRGLLRSGNALYVGIGAMMSVYQKFAASIGAFVFVFPHFFARKLHPLVHRRDEVSLTHHYACLQVLDSCSERGDISVASTPPLLGSTRACGVPQHAHTGVDFINRVEHDLSTLKRRALGQFLTDKRQQVVSFPWLEPRG